MCSRSTAVEPVQEVEHALLRVHRLAQQVQQPGQRVDRDRAPGVERRFGDEHRERRLARADVALDPQPASGVEVLLDRAARSGAPSWIWSGALRAMSLTGGRSKETPRYLRGMRPARLLRARAGDARRRGSDSREAVFVASSTTKPLPSHSPERAATARARCRAARCGVEIEPLGGSGVGCLDAHCAKRSPA